MYQLTRPVAPQQASRASSIRTWLPCPTPSSPSKVQAAKAPAIPEPMITISAPAGRYFVVRCPKRVFEGSECQKEEVEFGVGRVARFVELDVESADVPVMMGVSCSSSSNSATSHRRRSCSKAENVIIRDIYYILQEDED